MNAKAKSMYNKTDDQLTQEVSRIEANRWIWDQFLVTDPKFTKSFKKAGGFSGTSISPMYSVMRMTETFGPVGTGWGYETLDERIVEANPLQTVFIKGRVWYKGADGSVCYTPPAYGGESLVTVDKSGQIRIDDEAFKKAMTDSMVKCMTYLGVGSDVHMGRHDDSATLSKISKYASDREAALQAARKRKREADAQAAAFEAAVEAAEAAAEVDADAQAAAFEAAVEAAEAAVEAAEAAAEVDADAQAAAFEAAVEAAEAAAQAAAEAAAEVTVNYDLVPKPILDRISAADLNGLAKAKEYVGKVLQGPSLDAANHAIRQREADLR